MDDSRMLIETFKKKKYHSKKQNKTETISKEIDSESRMEGKENIEMMLMVQGGGRAKQMANATKEMSKRKFHSHLLSNVPPLVDATLHSHPLYSHSINLSARCTFSGHLMYFSICSPHFHALLRFRPFVHRSLSLSLSTDHSFSFLP